MFDPSFHERAHPYFVAVAEITASAALGTTPWWIQIINGFVDPILQFIVLFCASIVGVASVIRLWRKVGK